jgi:hypothetical protein
MATLAHWFYNTESGELTQSTNSVTGFFTSLGFTTAGLFGGAGWHELNIPGNATEAAAAAEAAREFPKGTAPTTSVATGVANAATQETGVSLTGLAAIGDFFGRLTEGATWIRVLELVLGVGLVMVGLAHAAAGTPAGRAAKHVAAVAAL